MDGFMVERFGSCQLFDECGVIQSKSSQVRKQIFPGECLTIGGHFIEVEEEVPFDAKLLNTAGCKNDAPKIAKSQESLSPPTRFKIPAALLQPMKIHASLATRNPLKFVENTPPNGSIMISLLYPGEAELPIYLRDRPRPWIDPFLAHHLRPHQIEGIQFLVRGALRNGGALLADEMGLGKSLQTIAALYVLLHRGGIDGRSAAKKALLVVPTAVIGAWTSEFNRWVAKLRIQPTVLVGGKSPTVQRETLKIFKLSKAASVLITSYEMARRYGEELEDCGLDLIIVDEAHRIKNEKIKLADTLKRIGCAIPIDIPTQKMTSESEDEEEQVTEDVDDDDDEFDEECRLEKESQQESKSKRRRSCLEEVDDDDDVAMHEKGGFRTTSSKLRRSNEITQTTEHQKELMRISPSTLENEEEIDTPPLPPIRFALTGTPVHNNLNDLKALLSFVCPSKVPSIASFHSAISTRSMTTLTERLLLRRTATQTLLAAGHLPPRVEHRVMLRLEGNQEETYSALCDRDEAIETELNDGNDALSKLMILRKALVAPMPETKKDDLLTKTKKIEWLRTSIKIRALDSLLFEKGGIDASQHEKSETTWHEKIVIVSSFTSTLDLLEDWCDARNLLFVRLDGATPPATRTSMIQQFQNDVERPPFVFLLSSKAGGVGLTLTAAKRMVIMEPDWNPANDAQVMGRIWRDGMELKSSVFIYRFVVVGTFEEIIMRRQSMKGEIADAAGCGYQSGWREKESIGDCSKNLFRYFPNSEIREPFMESQTADQQAEDDDLKPHSEVDEEEAMDKKGKVVGDMKEMLLLDVEKVKSTGDVILSTMLQTLLGQGEYFIPRVFSYVTQ